MEIEWIVGIGWNCRAEIDEEMLDYDRVMAEREIAIKYWAENLAETMLSEDYVY